jgi:protein TonB
MNNNINYAALSMNDIIFQGRNKDYGAYELRESYNRRIKHSMLGALFFVGVLCSYQKVMAMYHPYVAPPEKFVTISQTDVVIEKKLEIEKPAEPVAPKPPKPRGTEDASMLTNNTMVPTNSNNATDSVPTNNILAVADIGDHNITGAPKGPRGTEDGDLALNIKVKKTEPAIVETVTWATTMPEYPGGESAMMSFLARTIEYPDPDRQMDIQGKVIVGFVIDENGKVGDIRIVKGLTNTLNNEAVRVVSRLKDFKPGEQNGHRVKVRYNLPIKYTLGDQ